ITGVPGSANPSFDDLQDPGAGPAPAPAPAPADPAPAAAPQAAPSAAIDRAVEDMLDRPLRLVKGSTLEPVRAG
ncbi:MAG TPA: hypothetical protein VGM25_06855, partial [Caulobacteraceae bacterium]